MKFTKTKVENLPTSMLELMRFTPSIITPNGDKKPVKSKYAKPENYTTAEDAVEIAEVEGGGTAFAALDICGHGKGDNYVFLDFDHVLNASGEFVNAEAEDWYTDIQYKLGGYAEFSASGTGIHILAIPTPGKFTKITNKESGVLYFDRDKNIKLEVFYYPDARKTCHMTGEPFDTDERTIATGAFVDEVLTDILNEIQKRLPAKVTKQQTARADENRAELPADVKALVDAINALTPQQLMEKNYLRRSEHGAEHPTGYVCPWCGSGTGKSKTGALTYYTEDTPHFFCHARGCSGDVLKFLAKVYGVDDHGKNFFTLLKKTADDFAIPYDPKIFERDEDNVIRTQDRIRDCPVNLIIPENFIWTKSGITQKVPSKKDTEEFKYLPVTKTPIIITRKFREPSKGTVEFEIALRLRDYWQYVVMDGKTLTDARQLTELGNYDAIINATDRLKQFFDALRACNPDIEQIKSYKQTGWTSEDYDDFAFPSSNGNAVVRRQGYDYERILKPRGDREAWKKKFGEVTEQGGAIARTVIGFAAASFLVRPLGLPNLQFHLHGPRSIGKTPLEKFAVTPFGNPAVGSLTHTFDATPKSRLEKACAFRDLPLICEELETLSKREAEKIPQDIYNYSLGIGGQALKKDGTAREEKLFSGARLTNGEHSLVQTFGNAGEFKRVLDVRAATLLEEEFAGDLYEFCDQNHGLFLEQWINYIIENREIIRKHYNKALKEITNKQKGRGNENDRTQLSTLVASAVGYQHFKICIGLSNLATDADAMRAEFEADIETIICTLPTANEMNDTTRAVEFLKSFVAGSEKYFVHTFKNPNTGRKEDVAQYTADCYGKKFPDGRVAFLPHALKKILTDEGKGNFKSAEKIIAELADAGIIQTSLKGKPLGYAKIFGETKRAYIFEAGTISDGDAVDDTREHTETA